MDRRGMLQRILLACGATAYVEAGKDDVTIDSVALFSEGVEVIRTSFPPTIVTTGDTLEITYKLNIEQEE